MYNLIQGHSSSAIIEKQIMMFFPASNSFIVERSRVTLFVSGYDHTSSPIYQGKAGTTIQTASLRYRTGCDLMVIMTALLSLIFFSVVVKELLHFMSRYQFVQFELRT